VQGLFGCGNAMSKIYRGDFYSIMGGAMSMKLVWGRIILGLIWGGLIAAISWALIDSLLNGKEAWSIAFVLLVLLSSAADRIYLWYTGRRSDFVVHDRIFLASIIGLGICNFFGLQYWWTAIVVFVAAETGWRLFLRSRGIPA
jgi:hypothetical protein